MLNELFEVEFRVLNVGDHCRVSSRVRMDRIAEQGGDESVVPRDVLNGLSLGSLS